MGKKYKYEDVLSFLCGYFQERDTMGNISLEDIRDDEVYEHEDHKVGHFEESNTESVADNQSSKGHSTYQHPATRSLPSSSATTKKRKCEPQETTASTFIKYLLDRSQTMPPTPVHVDAVDAFLAGLAPTLKTFTPYYLNLAKTKIFSAVQEYEMAMILERRKQAASASGCVWEQGASYFSDTPLPSTSMQPTPVPTSQCSPVTNEHAAQPSTVSATTSEFKSESGDQSTGDTIVTN
jgi:hypothetical protein